MSIQINHARARIKTSIRSGYDARKYISGWRTNIRYQEEELVNQYRMNVCVSQTRTNQSRMTIGSINQSINQISHMWGPHQSPFIFA